VGQEPAVVVHQVAVQDLAAVAVVLETEAAVATRTIRTGKTQKVYKLRRNGMANQKNMIRTAWVTAFGLLFFVVFGSFGTL